LSEPAWLAKRLVVVMHDEALARFGGLSGIRDEGLLEASLDRPRNKHAYGERDLETLAAAYAFGLARNHPFVDGNKRAALLAIAAFMRKNGRTFRPADDEAVAIMVLLATGKVNETKLAKWIRAQTT
jgi:death on curing protein